MVLFWWYYIVWYCISLYIHHSTIFGEGFKPLQHLLSVLFQFCLRFSLVMVQTNKCIEMKQVVNSTYCRLPIYLCVGECTCIYMCTLKFPYYAHSQTFIFHPRLQKSSPTLLLTKRKPSLNLQKTQYLAP